MEKLQKQIQWPDKGFCLLLMRIRQKCTESSHHVLHKVTVGLVISHFDDEKQRERVNLARIWSLDFIPTPFSDVTPLSSLSLLAPSSRYVVLPCPSEEARPRGAFTPTTCGQRGSSWPRRWLCLPQCPGRGPRWSMTSWSASPVERLSWSGNMSTSTWTGCSASSCCRVRKRQTRTWFVRWFIE